MSDWLDNYLNVGSDYYSGDADELLRSQYSYDSGAEDAQQLLNASGKYEYDSGAEDAQKLLNASKGAGSGFDWSKLGSGIAGLLTNPAFLAAFLPGIAGYMDRQRRSGGGTGIAYGGYKPLTRTIDQGRYGPIARYEEGGIVAMEDGGFVMTKKAVDGAGGPQGIQQVVPGARMIRGPGTGTSDSIPAYIQSPRGRTPAAVSNGEAYVPKKAVQNAGGARQLYSLMNKLQRRA